MSPGIERGGNPKTSCRHSPSGNRHSQNHRLAFSFARTILPATGPGESERVVGESTVKPISAANPTTRPQGIEVGNPNDTSRCTEVEVFGRYLDLSLRDPLSQLQFL
jgi:hypothetical protein